MSVIKLGVYIGRFSPWHLGHAAVAKYMVDNYDYGLILVGSSEKARDIKNPWNFAERASMIRTWFDTTSQESHEFALNIEPLVDHRRDTDWITQVTAKVERVTAQIRQLAEQLHGKPYAEAITIEVHLTGSDRDDSTYYLRILPYEKDLLVHDEKISKALNATLVREIYFMGVFGNGYELGDTMSGILLETFLPPSTIKFINTFKESAEYPRLSAEFEFIKKYRESYKGMKYPPIFQTVDAVVVQSGHVLLIRRAGFPGNGLWALPGGFVNQNESLLEACVRELHEETGLQITTKRLLAINGDTRQNRDVFDDPGRSLRGRTITTAFLFKLEDDAKFPKIKSSQSLDPSDEDDALTAEWVSLSAIKSMREQFFEDHWVIIDEMTRGI
jgi:bifunctional NMN adenylyltransferase/nudix hydrolase